MASGVDRLKQLVNSQPTGVNRLKQLVGSTPTPASTPKLSITQQQEAAMPFAPGQKELNREYKKLDTLKALQLNRSYDASGGTTEYGGDIKQQEQKITDLAKQIPYSVKRTGTEVQDFVGKGLNSAAIALADFGLNNPMMSAPMEIADKITNKIAGVNYKDIAMAPLRKEQQTAQQRTQQAMSYASPVQKVLYQGVEAISAAAPQAALALMSGGTSLAETAPMIAGNIGLKTAVTSALSKMTQSPIFSTTFAQNYGSSYESAKADGASEDAAMLTATLTGLINSGIELTGGLEVLPAALKSGNANAVKAWVTSALSEGKEEVVQGIIERLVAKDVYDDNKPLASLTDHNAVFNPIQSAKEGAMGIGVAGVLGGGQVATNNVIQSIATNSKPQNTLKNVFTPATAQPQNTVLNNSSNTTDSSVVAQNAPQSISITQGIQTPTTQSNAVQGNVAPVDTRTQYNNSIAQLEQSVETARVNFSDSYNKIRGLADEDVNPTDRANVDAAEKVYNDAKKQLEESRTYLDKYEAQQSVVDVANEILMTGETITAESIKSLEQSGELKQEVSTLKKAFNKTQYLKTRIARLMNTLDGISNAGAIVDIEGIQNRQRKLTQEYIAAEKQIDFALSAIANYTPTLQMPNVPATANATMLIAASTPTQALTATVADDGLGAADKNSLGGIGRTKDTVYPINDNQTTDLNNLPVEDSKPNFDKPKKEGGFLKKWQSFYTRVVDTQHPLTVFDKIAKSITSRLASNAMGANSISDNILSRELVDREGNRIGKSLHEVLKQVPTNKVQDFWTYMMHRHNENRSVQDNNLIPNFNKAMSVKKYTEMEQANPEFKAMGDEIIQWIDTFMTEWGVNSGLIDPDVYSNLRVMYPNYFPTQRIFDDLEKGSGFGNFGDKFVDSASPLKKATGSNRDLNPIENIANLVNNTVRTATYNRVGQSMYDAVKANPTNLQQYAEIVPETSKAANVVSVFKDGKKVFLQVNDKPLLDALEGIPKATKAITGLSQANSLFKGLITQYNVLFGIKNFIRDIQTGYAYGSQANPFKYAAGELKAIKEILTNGAMYKRYRGVGGGSSNFASKDSISKFSQGLTKPQNIIKRAAKATGRGLSAFNNAIETATRLNEFMTVFDKTGDVQKALDAANNVTVNFARGGDITKTVDKNFVPYLNASVQGLDKFIRSFSSPRAAITMIAKAGLSTTIPTLIFYLLNQGNPNYEDEDDRTKDTYYLIPNYFGKIDEDGYPETFIKIPKSREMGVLFGALFERTFRAMGGESADSAFKGIGTSLATNFKPVDPTTSNLFSAATANLLANKDFAGRTIVSPTLQKLSPHLQYDEKTSEITKFIADIASKVGIELSPKVMDYLIDSYTGIIGDVLLPATTKGSAGALSPVTRAFTTDSAYSNQNLTNFYDNMDKAATAAADKNLLENIDSDVQTLEEKASSAYVKANTEMSILSKISARAGVGALTDEDVKLLKEYGIDATLTPTELQRDIKKVQIQIASDTMALANGKNEMQLDLNNNSDIAKAVDKYSSAGISESQAYNLTKTFSEMEQANGKYQDLTDYEKAVEINKQSYNVNQKTALLATLYTTRDEETGKVTKESLLPFLNSKGTLLSLYMSSKDSQAVSMTVPSEFTDKKVEYKMTDAERALFKKTFIEKFNARYDKLYGNALAKKPTIEKITEIRNDAYDDAKDAVLDNRK